MKFFTELSELNSIVNEKLAQKSVVTPEVFRNEKKWNKSTRDNILGLINTTHIFYYLNFEKKEIEKTFELLDGFDKSEDIEYDYKYLAEQLFIMFYGIKDIDDINRITMKYTKKIVEISDIQKMILNRKGRKKIPFFTFYKFKALEEVIINLKQKEIQSIKDDDIYKVLDYLEPEKINKFKTSILKVLPVELYNYIVLHNVKIKNFKVINIEIKSNSIVYSKKILNNSKNIKATMLLSLIEDKYLLLKYKGQQQKSKEDIVNKYNPLSCFKYDKYTKRNDKIVSLIGGKNLENYLKRNGGWRTETSPNVTLKTLEGKYKNHIKKGLALKFWKTSKIIIKIIVVLLALLALVVLLITFIDFKRQS